ncbi:hypothetical protein TREES_T100020244 [Tupaia chinensis]|uniref:Uncharacterized protein n=1 Tax=Tupaia chinensis TaxID=246437 RepID=L9L806_TUPCH|nr:hypothetical protein TREES_T100020244 [Tupaia chinensis]
MEKQGSQWGFTSGPGEVNHDNGLRAWVVEGMVKPFNEKIFGEVAVVAKDLIRQRQPPLLEQAAVSAMHDIQGKHCAQHLKARRNR